VETLQLLKAGLSSTAWVTEVIQPLSEHVQCQGVHYLAKQSKTAFTVDKTEHYFLYSMKLLPIVDSIH
jgi:hypothetical protein